MRLSVVIPTYCEPDGFLLRAIRSVIRQTLEPERIIVVEDGIQPNVGEIIHRIDDPRIDLIRLPINVGPLLARRAGIELTRSEFIAFQDADDESDERRFAEQVAYLAKHPRCAVVSCDMLTPEIRARNTATCTRETLLSKNGLNGGPCMVRRTAYDAVGGTDAIFGWSPLGCDIRYAEDYALWLTIAAAGWDVHRIGQILYTRHRHGASACAVAGKAVDAAGDALRRAVSPIWRTDVV